MERHSTWENVFPTSDSRSAEGGDKSKNLRNRLYGRNALLVSQGSGGTSRSAAQTLVLVLVPACAQCISGRLDSSQPRYRSSFEVFLASSFSPWAARHKPELEKGNLGRQGTHDQSTLSARTARIIACMDGHEGQKTNAFGTPRMPLGWVEESDSCRGQRTRVFGTQRNSLLREVQAAEEGLEAGTKIPARPPGSVTTLWIILLYWVLLPHHPGD